MRRIFELSSITFLTVAVCASVNAQSMPWINPAHTSVYAKVDVTSRQLDDIKQSPKPLLNVDSLNSIIAKQDLAEAVDARTVTYRYDRARTQQNLRNFVARTPDPAARANLEQIFAAQPRLMEEIREGAKSFGFDPHNVADAYAMWWMNAWLVANKRDEVPENGTIATVKSQVRSAFAATPDFAKSTDAERQEYAEALLLQATMLGSMFEQWKNDPKMLDQLADAARKGAEASGLDLSKITLTPNGFVPRKGADASGAVGADAETIRNARADAPADEGESSPLGLALAAGAGLGATLLGGLAYRRMV